MSQPVLESKRLILRPLAASDISAVQILANDVEIHSKTLSIPHPYTEGMAEEWISTLDSNFQNGLGADYAITIRNDSENPNSEFVLIGSIGLHLDKGHDAGSIGYWIGRPYRGNGYCTEAGLRVLEYGFDVMGLNSIHGSHFSENPASGKVMLKLGMKFEGTLRQRKKKNGEYKDLCSYSILRDEYLKGQREVSGSI